MWLSAQIVQDAPVPRCPPGASPLRCSPGNASAPLPADGPGSRPPARRHRLPGTAPPPLGRGGACRTAGHGKARTARTVGYRSVVARRRHRLNHRLHGASRFGARRPAPAGRTQHLGRTVGRGFRNDGPMRLYRASGALMAHREVIGRHLFDRAMGLFGLQRTVTPYDLTNTYFKDETAAEGPARTLQGQARRPPAACPGIGVRCRRLRVPLPSVRRQCVRAPRLGGDARRPRCPAPRPGGDGPRHRRRGARCVGCAGGDIGTWSSAANALGTSTSKTLYASAPRRTGTCISTRSCPTMVGRRAFTASPRNARPRSEPSSNASPSASKRTSPSSPKDLPSPAP